MPRVPLRWVAIGIFILSSALNYLDRQLLPALAPAIRAEFHLTNNQYGQILSVFSIMYAVTAPLAGLFIDRVGLNAGVTVAVIVWSFAGAAMGLARSFQSLLGWRTLLGMAEASGLPSNGKANGVYLEPRELALGTAFNQVGLSLGGIAAPLIGAALAPRYGWRSAFVVCGALGFVWVPLWWFTAKRVPAKPLATQVAPVRTSALLRDRRLWGLVFGTVFIMSLYTLWTNWTTLYFVHTWNMTQDDANRRYAWIPQVFGTLGGFFGGWLAYRSIHGGAGAIAARMRVCWISAVILVATAAIPLMPNSTLAAAAICLSFFWAVCISSNLYAMPIDLFGPARAAFGVAALTFAYGLMQAFLSPAIGAIVDHVGFPAVCVSISALPLIGVWLLRVTIQ